MPAGIIVSGNSSQTRDRGVEKIFYDEFKRYDPSYTNIFKINNWNEATLKEGQYVGLGLMQEVSESQPVPFEVLEEGGTKEIEFPEYKLGVQISRKAKDDDIHGIFSQIAKEMGKSAQDSKSPIAWDVLNTGFVSTYRTGKDSKALFASDHPLASSDVSSTTIDNSVTATLSYTSLQAGKNFYDRLVNEKNIPIMMKPKILVIPPELEWKAKELLLSEYQPSLSNASAGTATDNSYIHNSAADMGLRYIKVPFLTSTTAWFLLADEHDLRYIWRVMPEFKKSDDDNTGNSIMQSYMRCKADFFEWRGCYGSTGV